MSAIFAFKPFPMRSSCRHSLVPILSTALLLCFAHLGIAAAQGDPKRLDNTVILDEAAVKNLGIETVEAEETTFEQTIFALGRIQVAPGRRAVVASRVPGRALTVSAHSDLPIEKGAEIATIESRQAGDPPPTVKVLAPIAGLIAKISLVPGQPVSPDQTLVEIVDLTEVHAVAAVPEHHVGRLKPRGQAMIRTPAYPKAEFKAELAHLGAEADAASATLEAAFHVDNAGLQLRPGMRAEFHIVVGRREGVMSIPRSSLQGDAGGRFVYIKDYELKNAFVKTPVAIGEENDTLVEVTSGLNPGDEVVTRGAYSLAFAGKGSVSLKEALDAAHGHPHNEDGSEMTAQQQAALRNQGGSGSGGATGWTGVAKFFAGTTGLLFILLILALLTKRSDLSSPRQEGPTHES